MGPTASGKTNVALRLARRFAGEIVSADSRQIYKGMDIGTGKDIPASSRFTLLKKSFLVKGIEVTYGYYTVGTIPVWLVDLVEPKDSWSVAHFHTLALKTIDTIYEHMHLPIIVGGTGLYIKSLTDPIQTIDVVPNVHLRRRLQSMSVENLQVLLKKSNLKKWGQMNQSDRFNPRRLIRAIEVAKGGKKAPSSLLPLYDVLKIGLQVPIEQRIQNINNRVEKRVKNGVREEIQKLLSSGVSWESPGMNTLGYRQFRQFFLGQASLEDTISLWERKEHQYAKRQLTWFRKERDVHWFNPSDTHCIENIEETVRTWYTQ